jgi:hypothetical protein
MFVVEMLAFKAAVLDDGRRALVTLEIPSDALTNLKRTGLVDATKAQYRVNKARVLRVEDDEGRLHDAATSAYCAWASVQPLRYRAGETVEPRAYTRDPEQVAAAGIHLFVDREVARRYRRPLNAHDGDDAFLAWHANGQLAERCSLRKGAYHGLQQRWDDNGSLKSEWSLSCRK